jgi:hypothetical protein
MWVPRSCQADVESFECGDRTRRTAFIAPSRGWIPMTVPELLTATVVRGADFRESSWLALGIFVVSSGLRLERPRRLGVDLDGIFMVNRSGRHDRDVT